MKEAVLSHAVSMRKKKVDKGALREKQMREYLHQKFFMFYDFL
jgi:hypothetical protein